MEYMSEDARVLIRAAKEVHAANATGQKPSYPEAVFPFWKRQNAPVSGQTANVTTTP
jgi:hypothetical protein